MFATNVFWQSNEDILLLEESADTNLNIVATDPFLAIFSVILYLGCNFLLDKRRRMMELTFPDPLITHPSHTPHNLLPGHSWTKKIHNEGSFVNSTFILFKGLFKCY